MFHNLFHRVIFALNCGLYEKITTGADGTAVKSDLIPANWALLGFPDDYAVTSTDYVRNDSTEGKSYSSTNVVVDRPEPGSTHTMTFGLWPVS